MVRHPRPDVIRPASPAPLLDEDSRRLRALMEFCASTDELIGDLMPGHFEDGVVLFIVARVSIPDWTSGEGEGKRGIAAPDRVERSIRVNNIASPYGKSPSTIARRVHWLEANGWLIRTRTGLALAPVGDRVEAIAGFYRTLHDLFVRMAVDMAVAEPLAPALPPVPPFSPRSGPSVSSVLAQAMDVLLVPLEDDPVMRADVVLASVWGVLFALTLRRAADAAAGEPPISVRRVAAIMRLPYATAWRKFQALEQQGAAERTSEGWRIPDAILTHPMMGPALRRQIRETVRRTEPLGWAGASRRMIEAAYLAAPRPYAGAE